MSEWIKCSDRLSEEGEKVLSYSEFEREIRIDYLIYAPDPIWACKLQRNEIKVTHWMPLPMPPEE